MYRRFLAVLVGLTLAACGGSSPTGPGGGGGGGGNGGFSATVDGQAFGGIASSNATHAGVGLYSISFVSQSGRAISFALLGIPGPGSYPLGTGAGVSGGIAVYSEGGGGFATPLTGHAGTIAITTLTDSRIAGTFSFTAEANTVNSTGTRTVTNGSFDLGLNTTGTFGPVPQDQMNKMSATLGNDAYVGSTISVGASPSTNTLIISTVSTEYSLVINLTGLTGPGTFSVGVTGIQAGVSVGSGPGQSGTGDHCCWTSGLAGTSGSVVVTSFTAERIKGTFSFTIPANGAGNANGPLTVTNGTFDVGRPAALGGTGS